MRLVWFVLAMSSMGATASGTAMAQASPDSATADALFEQGRTALAQGNVALACDKFELSRRLEPAIGTLLNLGECSLKLERRRLAWIAFREALRFMPETDERRAYARARLAGLDAELARLVLRWEGAASPADRVTVNDEPIVPPFDIPRVIEPGLVKVGVERAGVSREFTDSVQRGGTLIMRISAPNDGGHSSEMRSDGGGAALGRRALGFTLTGVGFASLAAGAAFGVAALVSSSDARTHCGGGLDCPDPNSRDAARRDAEIASTRATLSTALVAGGTLIAVAGVYLLLTSRSAQRGSSPTAFAPLRFEF